MSDNASLTANLSQQFNSTPDPFGTAKLQQASSVPFNGMQGLEQFQFADPAAQDTAQSGSSMSALTPDQPVPFQKLAKDMGIDVSSLHRNPDLAKLQLGQRLQQLHGENYLQTPDAAKIFQSFAEYSKTKVAGDSRGDYTKKQDNTQEAVTSRTLAALMEGAPREG